MARAYPVSDGSTLTVPAPVGGCTYQNPIVINGVFGIPGATKTAAQALAGEQIALDTSGVWDLPTIGGQTYAFGDVIFWEPSTGLASKVATETNVPVGSCALAATEPALVRVVLGAAGESGAVDLTARAAAQAALEAAELEMVGATAEEAGEAGRVPAPGAGDQDKILGGDGTWKTVAPFEGATGEAAGSVGLVPEPAAGEEDFLLLGDGSWADPDGLVMEGATAEADGAMGFVPEPLIADREKFLKGDGSWATPAGGSGIPDDDSVSAAKIAPAGEGFGLFVPMVLPVELTAGAGGDPDDVEIIPVDSLPFPFVAIGGQITITAGADAGRTVKFYTKAAEAGTLLAQASAAAAVPTLVEGQELGDGAVPAVDAGVFARRSDSAIAGHGYLLIVKTEAPA